MAYKNRRKQRQKKNDIRKARDRMFAERREQAANKSDTPLLAMVPVLKAVIDSNRDNESK